MNALSVVAMAAGAAVSAGAGWMARGAGEPAVAPPVASTTLAAPARPVDAEAIARPLIAVSGDGQVTLRVEQRPLDWVLEQIALQSGRADLRAVAGVASPPDRGVSPVPASDRAEGAVAEAEACAAAIPPADAGQLLKTLEQGTDDERIPALQRARSDGMSVPEPVLRSLLETAASDRVRLVALDSWLESRAGDPVAERAALEAALLVPNAAVQAEARQRLGDLDETARLDALAAQGSP